MGGGEWASRVVARARPVLGAALRGWPALVVVLLAALALRLYGLNWDANNHLHPDEREIVFRAMCLTFPGQAGLRPTNCDPAFTGAGWFFSPASPLNPHFFAYGSFPLYLLAAVCRLLAGLTHLTGGAFHPSDGGTWDDFNHFTLVGRVLSALFDTGTVALTWLLGRRLTGPLAALLAAALVAVLPFEVQAAHFYAVDTVLGFAVVLTLLACVRLVQAPAPDANSSSPAGVASASPLPMGEGPGVRAPTLGPLWASWRGGLLVGFGLGLALATKVSALPLVVPVALALLLFWRRRGAHDGQLALLGVAAAALLTFLITSPYVLIDWATFRAQVAEQTALSRGQLDYPYVRQFAGTTPFVYQIEQMLLYAMGVPLGLLGLAGGAWAAARVWRRWDDDWLLIVSWLVVYFAVIGDAYTKFIRYLLPLFPLLALCGAAALAAWAARASKQAHKANTEGTQVHGGAALTPVRIDPPLVPGPARPPTPSARAWPAFLRVRAGGLRGGTPLGAVSTAGAPASAPVAGSTHPIGPDLTPGPSPAGRGEAERDGRMPSAPTRGRGPLGAVSTAGLLRRAPVAVALAVLLVTTVLALALDNVYSAPNTRVQASTWIYDHVAPGARITSEIWDDSLPILVPAARSGPGYGETAAGHVIDPAQYVPIPLALYDDDTPQKADELAQQLASADVVVISSQRLVRSIPKLPDRYPMTTRYYQLLFAGKLGFTLAAQFTNPPHLLGFTLDESRADESWSVYDHPPVWIFVRRGAPPSAAVLRALLTDGLSLPPPVDRSGSQKSLLLAPAAAAADAQSPPLARQFPPGSLPNRVPLLVWLLAVELLGLVSFPLAYRAFPGLRDRGWGLSKLLGLLLLAYALWLPANLGLVPFTNATTYAAFALLAVAGGALAWFGRAELAAFVRARWRLLAVCEGAFLVAFAFFTWVRALDPDLWHIWRGGEKPMELAYLDGILRSRVFPPLDPWFSGGYINYYYYGQYLIAVLIRLTGIAPTTAFNLAIPLLFAVTFTAAFSVVAGLTGRWWAGLAGGFGLVFVANLDGAGQLLGQLRAAFAHLPVQPFDYWASSRVIPYTINEFPYWSFLYADLHAHLIDLPIVVFVIAGCASLLAERRSGWRPILPTLAALALALGATGCVNTWDFPTCALLVAATLALRTLFLPSPAWSVAGGEGGLPSPPAVGASGGRPSDGGEVPDGGWTAVRARLTWPALRDLGAAILLTVGLAYALYLPFYAHYQNFVSGIGTVSTPTDPGQFAILFAIWLFLLASFFVVEARDRWERSLAGLGPVVAARAPRRLLALVAFALVVLGVAYLAGVKALLVVLLAAGLYLALDPRHPPLKLLTYALLLLGLAIALGVEIIYVRDFLDNSAWERMNTVFKFYYQVWVCFALGGALAFAQLAPRLFSPGAAPAAAGEDTDSQRGHGGNGDPQRGYGETAAPDADHIMVGEWDRRVPGSALPPPAHGRGAGGEDRLPSPTAVGEGPGVRALHVLPVTSLLRSVWRAAFLALLLGSLVFLVEGTAARVQDPLLWAEVQPPPGGLQPAGLSLDGMAYMRGWYPDDYAAINWINANPAMAGDPTIIEAASGPYQWFGRVSIYTGLPTVLGSGHEPEQRYPAEVDARLGDVETFYTTADPATALDILRRYGVRYVYVGGLERDCPVQSGSTCVPAPAGAIQKYATLVAQGALRTVYRHGDVTIYEVVR